jgi:carbonic anhydrase
MKALLNPSTLEGMPSVADWLKHADVARHVVAENTEGLDEEAHLRCLTEENVVGQLEHLRTLPVVAAAMARGSLSIHGWIYDIGEAGIHVFDGSTGQFVDMPAGGDPIPQATPMARFAQNAVGAA